VCVCVTGVREKEIRVIESSRFVQIVPWNINRLRVLEYFEEAGTTRPVAQPRAFAASRSVAHAWPLLSMPTAVLFVLRPHAYAVAAAAESVTRLCT
jgi:hypothetical protein